MAVVHLRKNSLPITRQWYRDENDDFSRVMLRRYFYQHKLCTTCAGFYGPNFEQPLCVTCHAFLYPVDLNVSDGAVVYQEKSDSDDSGTEEPSDFYETLQQRNERPPRVLGQCKLDKLSECITALISPKRKDIFVEGLMENLPSEGNYDYILYTVEPTAVYSSWRTIRLRNELKSLHSDPPEGIEAVPLDEMCFHWQATISGPADSPYEGGTFFLYLQIPSSYPMKPPIVRFITKIFHPNVSRHGDIGIDSIHDNWSLILTISKILISIQSLLTDPYCHVCMEPEIGHLYQENKSTFDAIAKLWTMRFAMLHRRPQILDRPPFISQDNGLNPNL
ncbi:uncharacterized protein [Parasteatoda tepidariorum]|uniref:uncharacterized protein n=1 Tax=Parasteatoda tepidariorum TaxID=114398 RepID=UPI001C719E74|nr:ubiquitin-conjugating enzyme E2 1 [Parasteatoda tepidariorum]